jgi:hypothetical protein
VEWVGGIRMSTITRSGSCSRTELDQLVRVARLADDLEVGSLEQAREPFAQKDVVVGHDDATAGGRLRSHDRRNLTPLPGSGYGKIPAVRLLRGALVGCRREAL